ncbi:UNVERIFIED_CONTAM: hypothetical protein PYX00_005608 [Menopon gallinae]|uniref:Uncharacterized protein n=1 Tax=Menopon gallinae TaxID=328185 RepID=A0AAW2HSH1_9NEOP
MTSFCLHGNLFSFLRIKRMMISNNKNIVTGTAISLDDVCKHEYIRLLGRMYAEKYTEQKMKMLMVL